MNDEDYKKMILKALGSGLMSQPSSFESFFYPKGLEQGLFGLGNLAVSESARYNAMQDQYAQSYGEMAKRGIPKAEEKARMASVRADLNAPSEMATAFAGMLGGGNSFNGISNKARYIADKIKTRIPRTDLNILDWGSDAGKSSYINLRQLEPENLYKERLSAWEAAKGTKRGPMPGRKVVQGSVRVSDHDVGPKRASEHMALFSDKTSDKEIDNFIESLLARVPWLAGK